MNLSIPPHILTIDPYKPGKPIEELEREYGIKNSIKLASNENPLGPSPKAIEAINGAIRKLNRYPDGSGFYLVKKLSEKLGIDSECFVLGNGSDEIISLLAQTLLNPGDEAIMARPSFLMYDILVRGAGAIPVSIPLKGLTTDLDAMLEAVTDKTRMIFINNPNNPTGTIITKDQFDRFIENVPQGIAIVIDEAYIEFVRDKSSVNCLDYIEDDKPIIGLRTFSKIYGLAGLRIGYGIMSARIARLLHRIRLPFNANSLAQVAALAALDDDAFIEKTIATVHNGLDYLFTELGRLGVDCFPTQTNFFLIDVRKNAHEVFEAMLHKGVIVRSMVSYGFPEYIRINAGLAHENERFIEALKEVLR